MFSLEKLTFLEIVIKILKEAQKPMTKGKYNMFFTAEQLVEQYKVR